MNRKRALFVAAIAAAALVAAMTVCGCDAFSPVKVFVKSEVATELNYDDTLLYTTTYERNDKGDCLKVAAKSDSSSDVEFEYSRDDSGYLLSSSSSYGITATFDNRLDDKGRILSSTMTIEGLNSIAYSALTGSYKLDEVSDDVVVYDEDLKDVGKVDAKVFKAIDKNATININVDGTISIESNGESLQGTWAFFSVSYAPKEFEMGEPGDNVKMYLDLTIAGEKLDAELTGRKLSIYDGNYLLDFSKQRNSDAYSATDDTYVVNAAYTYYGDSNNVSDITYSVSGSADPSAHDIDNLGMFWDSQFPFFGKYEISLERGGIASFDEEGHFQDADALPPREDRKDQTIKTFEYEYGYGESTFDKDGYETLRCFYYYDGEYYQQVKTTWTGVKSPSKATDILARLYE